ncbi:MAG: hypothetical protein ABSG76_03860 [Xanthobacteraceae bacterium]
MIIWSGKGILVFLIAVAGLVLGTPIAMLAQSLVGGGPSPDAPPAYAIAIGLLIAAAGNFYLARWLDDPAKTRTLVDPQTNQTFVLRDRSSLMFIPVRYWTYILVGLAVLGLVLAATGHISPAHPR